MKGSIKIPFLLILLVGIVIAAYLYVSRAEKTTQIPSVETPGGTTNPLDAAEDATNSANQGTRDRLEDAQSELYR